MTDPVQLGDNTGSVVHLTGGGVEITLGGGPRGRCFALRIRAVKRVFAVASLALIPASTPAQAITPVVPGAVAEAPAQLASGGSPDTPGAHGGSPAPPRPAPGADDLLRKAVLGTDVLLALAALGLVARMLLGGANGDKLNGRRDQASFAAGGRIRDESLNGFADPIRRPSEADARKRRARDRLFVSPPERSDPVRIRYSEVDTPCTRVPQDPPSRRGRAPLRSGAAVLGYVSVSRSVDQSEADFGAQRTRLEAECERRGLHLVELVRDLHGSKQRSLERPGLAYALEQLRAGAAQALIVSDLVRLGRSPTDLGTALAWLERNQIRLITVDPVLDTFSESGRTAVEVLGVVSRWERGQLQERTRKGLLAARERGAAVHRPAVKDIPELRQRILAMRAAGMTLQAIADRLNADCVPTVRGGAKWRPSSVQSTVGPGRGQPPSAGADPVRVEGTGL
jgi:DNA invertase Pin-like site-specific DNA recombinase